MTRNNLTFISALRDSSHYFYYYVLMNCRLPPHTASALQNCCYATKANLTVDLIAAAITTTVLNTQECRKFELRDRRIEKAERWNAASRDDEAEMLDLSASLWLEHQLLTLLPAVKFSCLSLLFVRQ